MSPLHAKTNCNLRLGLAALSTLAWLAGGGLVFASADPPAAAADSSALPPRQNFSDSTTNASPAARPQTWNFHAQNTDIYQYHPAFPAAYSGPNSLSNGQEFKDTVSLDALVGVRLWRGAEAHVDGLMWQGYGLSKTLGVEGFPSGEAFRVGTRLPNATFARVFLRQTIGLGGDEEAVADDELHLGGQQDVRRLTLTVGKISAKDIFDNNAYANDPRTQFMNWSLMANAAWDYAADSLGYIPGFAAELNQPDWAVRYGFFQVPRVANGLALDPSYLRAWQMVVEFERRYKLRGHPGVVRLLSYLTQAHMGSYAATLDNPSLGMDITRTRAYRHKFGYGLNLEQELTRDLGVFSRLGWSDGRTEGWAFNDVDRAATLGLSLKGTGWHRPDDTFGLAGILDGASAVHAEFLAAGGTGILAGDGRLSYGLEKILETYYDCQVWQTLHFTLDYQFISDPAFNRDRGPVSVLAARLHWEF
ncbi:MAG: carbohydrate porin [Verrucomicrobia bacterium]|nr:carbohydrate porin [Verrucomicrobiota bacterium]